MPNRLTPRRTFILAIVCGTPLLLFGPSGSIAADPDPEGWIDLLKDAGPALKGWSRATLSAGAKLNPDSQWVLDTQTGVLVCQGDKGHEWLRWDRELGDFDFRVEWRFTPVAGKKGYNSGIYARNSTDAKIWHQAQTGDASGGFLFGQTLVDGKLQRIRVPQKVDQHVKPAGDWNTFEIACKGKDMKLSVNGTVTADWHDCEVARGYVGLEAEGWRIEFRNVKVKPL
jgi:hypothetical protein